MFARQKHSAVASRMHIVMMAGAALSARAQMGMYGSYGDDMLLGLTCPEGQQPALMHTFGGVYEEGAYNAETTDAMSDEFNAVLGHVRGIASMPASGVSTADDARPDSSTPFTSGAFGGFLLFSDTPEFDSSPVDGLETYWSSEPHVDFGPTYVSTVSLNDEGRGAATVQVALCVPADLQGLGAYHMAIVIDVSEEEGVDSEECRGRLVDSLNGVAESALGAAAVPGLCGRQWSNWDILSFAEGINGFDFNKANSADDVGCVYNFDSAAARDAFVDSFMSMWVLETGDSLSFDACIGTYWAWKME